MTISMYVIIENHGVWEVVKIDGGKTAIVVQTNIRTYEKAKQARIEWQERELSKHER